MIKNTGYPADDADAWLAEFDALEQQRAFFFSMDRYAFTAMPR